MRVLSVIDSLDAGGGAERSLAALTPALCAAGVELHVGYLRARPHSLEHALRDGGAHVHSLAGSRGRLGAVGRCARLARQLQPDLVHTTLFEADQAGRVGGRIAGCTVVTSLVNVAYGAEQAGTPGIARWKYTAARALDVATAQLAARFHAITDYVADTMATRLHVPRTRIDVVARGRDPASLGRRTPERRARARRSLGCRDEQPVVVAIGRQEWQKGHDTLIAAVPRLLKNWPDLMVVIAGRTGQQSVRLQEAIERTELAARVHVLGFREDTAELLCAADVFAFPSRWEGLGSTLLEAMALEAPIVASDLPAVREVVTRDEAILVTPGDAPALAAAVDQCLGERTATACRTDAARRRFVEEFTIERSAAGMLAFYERALAG